MSRVVFEERGSGPAAARVESAMTTMKRRMVVYDGGLDMKRRIYVLGSDLLMSDVCAVRERKLVLLRLKRM